METDQQLGVISDSAYQRHMLQTALRGHDVSVAVSCEPGQFDDQRPERIAAVTCWIIELEDDSHDIADLMHELDDSDVPILFGLGIAPNIHELAYVSWQRRLISKVSDHLGRLEAIETEESLSKLVAADETLTQAAAPAVKRVRKPSRVADEIWVLAASLGGPAAVKAFIDCLPANIGYGFLYAQHVDAHFSKVLTDVLGRHSQLDLHPMRSETPIMEGEIQVVPVDRQVNFSHQGCVVSEQEWPGPYGPSIDQLLTNVCAHFGARCHVIVFSGMGNDGALAVPKMSESGSRIWTQSPDSCAHYSMPQSVIDLGYSQLSADPESLAHAIVELAAQENRLR